MPELQDFIVLDTEGRDCLTEIAIVDGQGQVIYEACTPERLESISYRLNRRDLAKIISEITEIIRQKLIVCHGAEHDEKILKRSYRKVSQQWPSLKFACTFELAQTYFPRLPSYSLESLSKQLQLQVNGQYFRPDHAHAARYDAEFTYQLYCHIKRKKAMSQYRSISNPFSSSRVDNPFQCYPDWQLVYHNEFELLTSILDDIRNDDNHQSRASVVIGEPGSGKTHLMMRLAQERLKNNRLLFIRRPNHEKTVLYHTYARILESFFEKVPDTERTQLELLLANSFVKILESIDQFRESQKGQDIIKTLQNNSLSLYTRLGAVGTHRNRENWQSIEKHITRWWTEQYSAASYSANLLKGIIKFCSYTDPKRREWLRRWLAGHEFTDEETAEFDLTNWHDEIDREEFSLEAMSVFGKLSTLDEPLIIVFDQLEGLGESDNEPILRAFSDAVKEILTHVPNSLVILNLFPDRWRQFQASFDGSIVDRISQHQIFLNRPAKGQLRQILELRAKKANIEDLSSFFNTLELDDILSQSSIRSVINRAADYYRLKVHGINLPDSHKPNLYQNENVSTIQIKTTSELESRVEKLEDFLKELIKVLEEKGIFSPDLFSSIGELNECDMTRMVLREYLKQQRESLDQDYDRPKVIDSVDDIGKLIRITNAFKLILNPAVKTSQLSLGRRKIPEHLCLAIADQTTAIAFLQENASPFYSRIKNFNQLVNSSPKMYFLLIRDSREPAIRGKASLEEIEKLKASSNGEFIQMDRQNRIKFELIDSVIVAIQERDLEIDLSLAMELLLEELNDYWLIKLFQAGSY